MEVNKKFRFEQKVSKEIFENKYCLNGETSVEEVLTGIAKDISMAEKTTEKQIEWEEKFYDEMINQRLFPAGRILANARPNTKMRFFNNCYTIGIDDSIEDIYKALKDDAKISSTGGGVGINVSKIRYKGCPVSKGGESSGVISFLKVFDQSAQVIHTGGQRRAAHIAILSIDHPEIEEFITCKRGEENNTLTQFNISVALTDAFMEAKEADADWDLVFDGKVVKTVKARYLYDLLTKNSYEHNEPGAFNIDTVEKFNNGHYAFNMNSVNPCFTGNSLLRTSLGDIHIKNLVDTPHLQLQGIDLNFYPGKVWSNGIKDIVEVSFYNKDVFPIKCTPDHVFMLIDGTECKAIELKGQQIKRIMVLHEATNLKYVQYGFLQGDGDITRINSTTHRSVGVNIGKNDDDIFSLFSLPRNKNRRKFKTEITNQELIDLGFDGRSLNKRQLPNSYWGWSNTNKSSFLQGLFSANGCVVKHHRVSFKSTSYELIQELKTTLFDDFKINAYFTTNKAKKVKFTNGEFLCKESYDLNISKYTDISLFAEQIGFYHEYKKKSLTQLLLDKTPYVKAVKVCGKEEVFDFTIQNDNHWGIVNGVIAHNCGF